ncbi:MAG: cation-translocating P-type ATPase, partial [Thermoguttaceae bacterium]|nr:cation-translocating P-type ATPase [Thermoguttaceae bacterium]
MIYLTISGMTCAACSARVEKALKSVANVDSVVVNLLTNTAKIEGTANVDALIEAVQQAGYDARNANSANRLAASTSDSTFERQKFWTSELLESTILLLALFYVSTGATMLKFPLPSVLSNPGSLGVVQLFLASFCIFTNRRFFIEGVASVFRLAPNMDALVALGSGVSFLYSFGVLVAVVNAYAVGDSTRALELGGDFYFESAAAILVFIGIGKRLEARAKGKTTSALKSLAKLAPDKATVVRNGVELEIDANDVKLDEVFLVRPGQRVPVDG